jgi:hypothetical protein
MFLGARPIDHSNKVTLMWYGVSQFLGIMSALFFVISADAYPARPRVRRGYALVLLAVLFWFALAPMALDDWAVFAPGHVLIAGAMAAAGVGHLLLLRQVRMLGAAVVGVSLILIAASHVWVILRVEMAGAPGMTGSLAFSLILYLFAALGMQLMTFEDMTLELRRTNRRLEAAQSKLRRMVITDPLTGCRNRRFFEEIIGRELQRHRRYGIPMSVLFVDVDRFQGRQRYARPRRRRPGPAGSCRVSAQQHPRGRLRVQVGRRRVPYSPVVRRGRGAPSRHGAPARFREVLEGCDAANRRRAQHRLCRSDRRTNDAWRSSR